MDSASLADLDPGYLQRALATMSNQTDPIFGTIQHFMDLTADPNSVFSHEDALCHSKTLVLLKSYINKQPRGPLKARGSAQIAIILRRLKSFINVR
jgi:hypothetical protein